MLCDAVILLFLVLCYFIYLFLFQDIKPEAVDSEVMS